MVKNQLSQQAHFLVANLKLQFISQNLLFVLASDNFYLLFVSKKTVLCFLK